MNNKTNPIAIACLLLLLLLTACTRNSYLANQYEGVSEIRHSMPDGTYLVWDKPDEEKIKIRANIQRAVTEGATQILTLGLSDPQGKKPIFEKAVISYLKSTGRTCQIENGFHYIGSQWEFVYNCAQ